MPFRDDLQAARDQIEALEGTLHEQEAKLREEKARADAEKAQLQERIDDLEEQLGRARKIPSSQIWAACWLPAIVVLVLYGFAFFLAAVGEDGLAWGAAQFSIVTGILGTAWSWGLRGKLWPWGATALAKILLITVWAWEWWHPLYSEMDQPSTGAALYFFWAAPLVIFAFVLVEGFVIRMGLKPVEYSSE